MNPRRPAIYPKSGPTIERHRRLPQRNLRNAVIRLRRSRNAASQ
jgi:hypothetical protein